MKKVFYKIVLMLFILTACSRVTPQSTSSLIPTVASTINPHLQLTPTPSRTPIPWPATPTYEPTLSADQEQSMKELLQEGDCKPPCYLGIIPGKTSLSDAMAILASLGGSRRPDYKGRKDGAIEYPYDLNVEMLSSIIETPVSDVSATIIYHDVGLITNNDIVQIIEVGVGTAGPGVSTTQALTEFREYWSRYSVGQIFLQMGMPDQLYVEETPSYYNGRTLLIAYEKQGAVIQVYGTRQENNICPENEAKYIYLQLSLFNINSLLSVSPDVQVLSADNTVEKVFGITYAEFYNQVISNPSVCFKPK